MNWGEALISTAERISTMKAALVLLLLFAFLVAGTASANAGFIPIGVQNDVPFSTVTNDWGWTVAYRGSYADTTSIADMFSNTGDLVMLAAIQKGATSFDVLAAAMKSSVQTYTPLNVTHAANGAEWYYNGDSMGFAGLGKAIFQNTVDIAGQPTDRDRLSWATAPAANGFQDSTQTPAYVWGGRPGFDRVVLTLANPWGLLQNGGFESPGFDANAAPGYYRYLSDGDTSIAGWTVLNDGIGEAPYWTRGGLGSPYQAAGVVFDGAYSVSLNAGSGLKTTFSEVAGQTYRFSIAAEGGNTTGPLEISIGGQTFDLHPGNAWGQQSFDFTASVTNPNADLTIFNTSSGKDYQIYNVDDASLTALPLQAEVPEPGTIALLSCALGVFGIRRLQNRM